MLATFWPLRELQVPPMSGTPTDPPQSRARNDSPGMGCSTLRPRQGTVKPALCRKFRPAATGARRARGPFRGPGLEAPERALLCDGPGELVEAGEPVEHLQHAIFAEGPHPLASPLMKSRSTSSLIASSS